MTDEQLEELKIQLDNYKTAWNKLKSFVEDLQEGHENTYAYSNEYIDYVLDEMNQMEEKLLTNSPSENQNLQ